MSLSNKKIIIKNITISFIDNEISTGIPILFVHGWGCSHETLQSIYTPFLNEYRIIAIDLPGFGESSPPSDNADSLQYADYLYLFLRKLKIDKVNYVGHSFGGKIGIILSATRGSLINRLVLIDSSGLRAKRYLIWYIKVGMYKIIKFIIKNILKNEKLLNKYRNKVGSDDYRNADNLRNILVRIVNEDFSELISQIKCPVFLYWGEKDKATPLWMAKKMHKLIDDAGLYVVKEGNHYSFLQDKSIIAIMQSFFS